MTLPDGFQSSTPSTSKPQRRVTEFPRFTGFETPARANTSTTAASNVFKPLQRPSFAMPSNHAAAASHDTKLKALKPPIIATLSAGPSTHTASSSKFRVLRPPAPAEVSMAGPTRNSSNLRSLTSAVTHRPISSTALHTDPSHVPITSIPNRTLVPRQSTAASTPSSLKPLPPPPPLTKRTANSSNPAIKSIMQTNIAKATDIHTDGGSAELLSIFPLQNVTGYVNPYDRELNRGVEQSPEKRSKAKNAKYLRGGLAEAANLQLSVIRNNHILWEVDLARMQKKGQFARPEVHIRVHSILDASSVHNPKSSHAPHVILIRGTVISSDSLEIRRGEVTALFRLSEVHHGPVKLSLQLAEGREVHAWRPWTHITRPGEEDGGDAFIWCFSRFHVFESKKRRLEPFPMIPSQ